MEIFTNLENSNREAHRQRKKRRKEENETAKLQAAREAAQVWTGREGLTSEVVVETRVEAKE